MKPHKLYIAVALSLTPVAACANDMNAAAAGMMVFPLIFSAIGALMLRRKIRNHPEKTWPRILLNCLFWIMAVPGYLAAIPALKDPAVIGYILVLAGFAAAFYFAFKTALETTGRQEAAAGLKKKAIRWATGLVLVPTILITSINLLLY